MARISIDLPEDLRAKAEARAAESGHATLEQYLSALVRADADTGPDAAGAFGAPDHLTFRTDDELESMLANRLGDEPGMEATPEFWRDLRERAKRVAHPGRST